MTEPDDHDTDPAPETARRRDAEVERRRRRARVFGEVLPEATADDRDESPDTGDRSEEWLKRQVPPHHGG